MTTPHRAGSPTAKTEPAPEYDVDRIRQDFPALHQQVHGKQLVYLDNAATTQKPQSVIDRLAQYYAMENANIHRGIHYLSERATAEYEESRSKVQRLLNAREAHEIIFVRGTTEAINLVAATYGRSNLQEGDEVIISAMEHHSNIVPWQIVCEEKGAHLRVVPVNDAGELDMEAYEQLLGPRTKIVSISHMSNALGTINPVRRIVELAHRQGVPVMLDGAQAVSHLHIDVQDLDCDFYAFSGHKLYGPTGIGVLYGKADLLEAMPPYQGGGEQISSVTFEKTLFNDLPYKFEAGTPHIGGVIGMGVAIDYVTQLGLDRIGAHERELLAYATEKMLALGWPRLIGTAREKASVLSFVIEGIHPHDIGTVLDREGVAIRAGHHCTQPLMQRFGVAATARASLGLYTTREEIDTLTQAVLKVREVLA